MANLTIRNLDEPIKSKLRIRAAEHGRSMEEEARQILAKAVFGEPPARNGQSAPSLKRTLADDFRELFGPLGGVDLPEIKREMGA